MQIPANIVLQNQTVLLRRLQLSDVENLLPFALQQPQIWQFSLQSAAGQQGLTAYIQTALQEYEQGYSFPFIVWDKKTNQWAGSTRFYDILPAFNTMQLGYTWYGSQFQGTGLNKNCKFLLMQYVFETLQIDRLEFRADNDNLRSIAAMKSIGCKVDGVLRSNMPKPAGQPGRRDSIVLSVLKTEWENDVKHHLLQKLKAY